MVTVRRLSSLLAIVMLGLHVQPGEAGSPQAAGSEGQATLRDVSAHKHTLLEARVRSYLSDKSWRVPQEVMEAIMKSCPLSLQRIRLHRSSLLETQIVPRGHVLISAPSLAAASHQEAAGTTSRANRCLALLRVASMDREAGDHVRRARASLREGQGTHRRGTRSIAVLRQQVEGVPEEGGLDDPRAQVRTLRTLRAHCGSTRRLEVYLLCQVRVGDDVAYRHQSGALGRQDLPHSGHFAAWRASIIQKFVDASGTEQVPSEAFGPIERLGSAACLPICMRCGVRKCWPLSNVNFMAGLNSVKSARHRHVLFCTIM
mmetsp:Transcript_78677/g.218487  ORF Transcript_78677/g.218487 Transcript_78677/m.218487 type:complete len:316 (-) Transcript_78677:574-1521(-)